MTDCDELVAIARDISRFGGPIDEETRVWHDLHLSGDDAYEMLETIRNRFGVSFKSMDFSRCFPDETEGFFYMWAERFGLRSRFEPLALGHLLAVIQAGQWHDAAGTNAGDDGLL